MVVEGGPASDYTVQPTFGGCAAKPINRGGAEGPVVIRLCQYQPLVVGRRA